MAIPSKSQDRSRGGMLSILGISTAGRRICAWRGPHLQLEATIVTANAGRPDQRQGVVVEVALPDDGAIRLDLQRLSVNLGVQRVGGARLRRGRLHPGARLEVAIAGVAALARS